ncbi:unnamed protein product [Mytilus edulis]|uniref:IRG-type G domain-containing protein n=1 Tax=Mytilus edulis TaxID=6550 RepID=A0A8S3SWV4_MYTED|nr:unnamed protein product [Mytilus edulis]
MNSSEVIRCQNCISNIHQCQRYCEKCGRENKSMDKGTLCTGTIKGIHCSNVIYRRVKFCSGCGTENSAYLPDSNSEGDLTSSTSLYREEEVNQEEKWEPTNKADDSATRVDEDTDQENSSDLQAMKNDAELNDIFAKLEKEGKMETSTYIRKKLAEVKTMMIKFAVIGRSAVGKSSFINMMLDLQPGDENYAETGAGDTTKNAYPYKHPKNKNITFWDMPGFGSMEMTVENFSNKFGSDLNTYDYFFIFIDTVIMEGDLWLVKIIKGYGTPYCFMRSKLDEDIKKGRTKEEIRQKLERSIQANSTVKGSALFLLSNEKSYIHTEICENCFSHITRHLPLVMAESLAFFFRF